MDSTVVLQRTSAMTWYVVGLLCLAQIMGNIDRMALAVLLPAIKKSFLFSDVELGLIAGVAFSVSYSIAGLPIARLADRYSRSAVLGVSVIAWSAMTAATGMAHNFWQLFATRAGIGVGEAGCVPPSHSMIVDLVPRSRRAVVLGFYTASQPFGAMLGLVLGGWLGSLIGWRLAFASFGVAGVLLAMVYLLTTREPARSAVALQAIARRESFTHSVSVLLKRRSYALTLAGLAFSGFVLFGLLQWLPSYYIRTFERGAGGVGTYFGMAYGVGAMVGILGGGLIGDRLCARDARWPLWMASGAYVFSLPAMLGAIYVSNFYIAMILIFVSFAILSSCYAPVYAMIQAVSPPHLRALAVSLTLFAASIVGSGLGPVLVGFTSDMAHAHAASNPLRVGLLTAIAFFPFPAICYVWASSYAKVDTQAGLAQDDQR
jgi:MFS family permease